VIRINNDLNLFKQLSEFSKSNDPLFNPGPYWYKKTQNAVDEILRIGISDFRGYGNGCGNSFADNPWVDPRTQFGTTTFRKLMKRLLFTKASNYLFRSFVNVSIDNFELALKYKNSIRTNSKETQDLLLILKNIDTLVGSPMDVTTDPETGKKVSNHYLDLLASQVKFDDLCDFGSKNSYFEIGGGFGVNLHLIQSRYPNLKKFLYLDLSPNIYVAIQYLRSIYGETAVKDPIQLIHYDQIEFESDDQLEIICILPEQIKLFKSSVDIFWNSHSFVEMPQEVVINYFKYVQKLRAHGGTALCLISYGGFDPETTFNPSQIPSLLGVNLEKSEFNTLEPGQTNLHFYGEL
jgi:putative sugar O-methyltransferase